MLAHLHRFAKTTSLKGVPRAVKSEFAGLKGIWVIAVLILLTCCILQVCIREIHKGEGGHKMFKLVERKTETQFEIFAIYYFLTKCYIFFRWGFW